MLINLYGNIINPNSIMRVKIAADGDGYNLFFNGAIDASSQDTNILTIAAETVQTVDGLRSHDTSEIYMLNMINRLAILERTSGAKGNNDADSQEAD